MIRFRAQIEQFGKQGEKTGWCYIKVPADLAVQIHAEDKKSFRVKGSLDRHPLSHISLVPMGGGDYILAVNASMRKSTGKGRGAFVDVQLEKDHSNPPPSAELMECLADEPAALEKFKKLPPGHQRYYSNWIQSAKTEATRVRRIAATVNAMEKGWNYGQMLRALREEK